MRTNTAKTKHKVDRKEAV